jgi:hypothetical protein
MACDGRTTDSHPWQFAYNIHLRQPKGSLMNCGSEKIRMTRGSFYKSLALLFLIAALLSGEPGLVRLLQCQFFNSIEWKSRLQRAHMYVHFDAHWHPVGMTKERLTSLLGNQDSHFTADGKYNQYYSPGEHLGWQLTSDPHGDDYACRLVNGVVVESGRRFYSDHWCPTVPVQFWPDFY